MDAGLEDSADPPVELLARLLLGNVEQLLKLEFETVALVGLGERFGFKGALESTTLLVRKTVGVLEPEPARAPTTGTTRAVAP